MKALKSLSLGVLALVLVAGCEKDSSGSGGKNSVATESEYQYTNPVLYADCPDPSVCLATDGRYYLYATARNLYMYSSADLVDWKFEGEIFNTYTRPNGNYLYAPDMTYIDGHYLCYYSVEGGDTTLNHIRVMTSDGPTGPFTDHGIIIDYDTYGVRNSIDQCFWQEDNGTKYMFWGSFNGIYVIQLSSDGLTCVGNKQQVAGTLIEGTMIFKHGDYYYMIGSAGHYTGGEESTYHLVIARSDNILGPYKDKDGGLTTQNQFSPFLNANDEAFGPGHNSEVLDMSDGTTWFMYHGYTYHNINYGRVDYLSQIFWDNTGWPYVVLNKPSITWDKPPVTPRTFSYSSVDYMEFQGQDKEGRYVFDTGYVPNANTRVELKFRAYPKTGSGSSSSGSLRRIFQANESSDSGFSLYINSSGDKLGFSNYGNNDSGVVGLTYDTDYEVSATLSTLTVNGQEHSLSGGTTDGKWERITLFSGPYDYPFMGRLYYFRIYEGNTMIHNFEPVLRNEDKVLMFHDGVSGAYYLPFDAEGFNYGYGD